jgi:hypothetical protein
MAKNSIKFKVKSPANLISFLKRFKPIESSLLLEVTPVGLSAKSYTSDRSTVKYSQIPMEMVLEGQVNEELIKVGILDIDRVCNVFRHFDEGDEIFMLLSYEKFGDDVVGTDMKFTSSTLKINVNCTDLGMFTYISQEILQRITSSVEDELIVSFPYPRDAFYKIGSLCSMDSKDDIITILVKDGKILIKSKSFEYQVGEAPNDKDVNFSFYIKQFPFIDQEISSFLIGHSKMLVKSQESNSLITIGGVEQ